MVDVIRKKSPRAPSLALEDAVAKALQVYDKESRHEVPAEAVAQSMGYNGTKNGSALAALASLRYYGLVDRPRDGMLSITKDVETYKFAPENITRQRLLKKWVETPPIYAELLQKYAGSLPSDATIKFDLIQAGFTPAGASDCLLVFRKSVEFAHYFDDDGDEVTPDQPSPSIETHPFGPLAQPSSLQLQPASEMTASSPGADRIPIRLPGNRRAWLEIPAPFFASDKARIKAQIDLLLTDDEIAGEAAI